MQFIAQTHITNNYSNYIKIYTDGSKNDEHKLAGAAYVVYNTQNAVIHHSKVKYTKHLTIFTCELAIINSALTWLNESETHELFNYVIISDSLSALQALKACTSRTRPDLIYSVLKNITKLTSKNISI